MKKTIRLLILVLCVIMLAGCTTTGNDPEATATPEPTPEPTPYIDYEWVKVETEGTEMNVKKLDPKVNGRYSSSATIYTFNYSDGGISFGFTGTSVAVDFNGTKCWVGVYIDDMPEIVVHVEEKGFYTLATGLDPEKIHDIKIAKRSESNAGQMQIKTIKIDDGAYYCKKEYKEARKQISVLGDSIACGYGNLYGLVEQKTSDYCEIEDGTNTFATMLGKHYNADVSICCISGIGVGNKANSPWPILPSYKVDGQKQHNFANDNMDVVIIELGENDAACGNTGDEFVTNGIALAEFVREKNPNALIIWYYGIMGRQMVGQIEQIVKARNDAGDSNIYALFTEKKEGEAEGGAGHPAVPVHQRMCNELVEFINGKLGWN